MVTRGLLFNHYCADNPRCSICDDAIETTFYALRDCAWVRSVWDVLVRPDLRGRFVGISSAREWVNDCLSQELGWDESFLGIIDWETTFRVGVYGIWNRRNVWGFSEEQPSSSGTLWWIKKQAHEW